MENDPGKVKAIANIKQIEKRNKKLLRTLNKLKKEIKSGNVMPAQIGCATCTSSTLALSTGNCKIHVFLFINRTFSTRIHVTAILSSIGEVSYLEDL